MLGAAPAAPVLRRRLPRIARRVLRQRARIHAAFGVAAPAATPAPVVIRRVRMPARRPQRARIRRLTPHGVEAPPVVPGQGQVFVRMLRAVTRMRQQIRRRLFYRPPPEVLPAPEEIAGSFKGRVFCPGLKRGRVHTAGPQ